MSTARKILENTAVQFGGKIVTAILSILVVKMLTGYLDIATYGQYNIAYNYLALFAIVADFGIYTITVKEMSKDEKNIPKILGNVLGLRTIFIILTMAIAVAGIFLVPNKYQDTVVPMGVLIGSLATLFTLLNGTISTVLQVHLKMQYTTVGLIIGKIISVSYMAFVVYFLFVDDKNLGFEHLMWAGVIGNLAMFLITFYYVSRYAKIRYRFDFDFWKKIFWESLPYGLALVFSGIYFRLDTQLLASLLPPVDIVNGEKVCLHYLCGDNEAGLYSTGLRFLEILVIIPVYFMNSVMPTMTRYLEEGKEKVKKVIQHSFDFLLAIVLPMVAGGFILAIPIVRLISQENYVSGNMFTYGADIAIQYLVFAMLFSFLNVIFAFTLVVLNKQKKLIYINGACVIFNIATNLLAIPHWGFRGAAFTTILCELLILILTARAVKKDLQLHLSYKTASKIFISSLTMGLVIWLGYMVMTNSWFVWQLFVLIPVGILVYVLMLFITKTLTPEMKAVLGRK